MNRFVSVVSWFWIFKHPDFDSFHSLFLLYKTSHPGQRRSGGQSWHPGFSKRPFFIDVVLDRLKYERSLLQRCSRTFINESTKTQCGITWLLLMSVDNNYSQISFIHLSRYSAGRDLSAEQRRIQMCWVLYVWLQLSSFCDVSRWRLLLQNLPLRKGLNLRTCNAFFWWLTPFL